MRRPGIALQILAVPPIREASPTPAEREIHEALPIRAVLLIRGALLIRVGSSIPVARSIRATPRATCMAFPVVTLSEPMEV